MQHHDIATPSGVTLIAGSVVLQFLEVHTGLIVSLCSILGLCLTAYGTYRKVKNSPTRKKRR